MATTISATTSNAFEQLLSNSNSLQTTNTLLDHLLVNFSDAAVLYQSWILAVDKWTDVVTPSFEESRIQPMLLWLLEAYLRQPVMDGDHFCLRLRLFLVLKRLFPF